MKMEGDVMRMRPTGTLDLPVGKAFELTPGGYHLMLQDLKGPLKVGSTVPITLIFRSAKGVETRMNLSVPVALGAPSMDHKH
jgi:periplasmic copper chaperone A